MTESGSTPWVGVRRHLGQRVISRYLSYHGFIPSEDVSSFAAPSSDRSIPTSDTQGITLAITTCKRMELFSRTISSLFDSLGPLPNSLIRQVIIIDDNSSLDDRISMMTAYPDFTFLFKSPRDKGHASSMNHLYRIIKTKYLLYLEDDWLLNHHIAASNQYARELINLHVDYSTARFGSLLSAADTEAHPGIYPIILSSLAILGFQGAVQVPSMDFASSIAVEIRSSSSSSDDSKEEQIHQVLFNEQSSRACAEGRDDCDFASLGSGGWERSLQMNLNYSTIASDYQIPYALHEFGLLPLGFPSSRSHTFSDWPGFSLNPSLLDVDFVKKSLSDLAKWQGSYFRTDLRHHSFEQLFSAILYSRGMNMAYLPLQCFRHIGENRSAYELMGEDRRWQRTSNLS
jgi:hypothetical protein